MFGGFDQPIGRHRVFGRANVGYSSYLNETDLNSTSYDISGGLDWSAFERLSGTVNVSLNQYLSVPATFSTVPDLRRNIANTQNIDAVVRYGGASLLTLEGRIGYSNVDYSLPQYQSDEAEHRYGSVGLNYNPGGPLRLGIGLRYTTTDSPESAPGVTLAGGGQHQRGAQPRLHCQLRGVGAASSAGGRVSYTRQTNSGITAARLLRLDRRPLPLLPADRKAALQCLRGARRRLQHGVGLGAADIPRPLDTASPPPIPRCSRSPRS